MKPVNIFTLAMAHNFDIVTFNKSYACLSQRKNPSIKEREKSDLRCLVKNIYDKEKNIAVFDGFYFSFTIPRISKEFDLLKITNSGILNIELKSQKVDLNHILYQLIKNRHYLRHLSDNIVNITYVRKENKFFLLKDNSLIEITPYKVRDILVKFASYKINSVSIDKLFKPNVYLISPLNDTHAFLDREYFLTDHQEKIKDSIIKYMSGTKYRLFPLDGDAGTGKTLLMYDIAREISLCYKALFIHCGELCDGHNILKENLNITIISQNDYKKVNLNEYPVIFVDEGHRIIKELFNRLLKTKAKIIFAVDIKQCTNKNNSPVELAEKIRADKKTKYFHLTNTIRINKELSSFTKNMFNLFRKNPNMEYENIQLLYAENKEEFKSTISYYIEKNHTFINYQYKNKCAMDREISPLSPFNTSNVTGQEFDKVVMYMDKRFYYNENVLLSVDKDSFSQVKLLYQGITRAREKLTLIIYKNKDIYIKLMEILTGENIKNK